MAFPVCSHEPDNLSTFVSSPLYWAYHSRYTFLSSLPTLVLGKALHENNSLRHAVTGDDALCGKVVI